MLSFFNKNKKENLEIGFEERERKTPVLGYVLLISMSFLVLYFGFSILSDISDVVEKPEALSYCSYAYTPYEYRGAYRYTYHKEDYCNFSEIEKKYKIDKLYLESKPLRDEISSINSTLSNKRIKLSDLERKYQLGLSEDIAGKDNIVFNSDFISSEITRLNKEISELKFKLNQKEVELKPFNEGLGVLYSELKPELDKKWAWYDFYVFLLQLLFILPLFIFLFKLYLKLSAKNSPHLIIITFLLIPASIFLLAVVLKCVWALFLAEILEIIFVFINKFQIFKVLFSYFLMLVSTLFFAFLVYLLQKKIFDPKRLAKKHLRAKRCPDCSFSLDLSANFCSNCGHQMLEKCKSCDGERYIDLGVCRYCGDKRLK